MQLVQSIVDQLTILTTEQPALVIGVLVLVVLVVKALTGPQGGGSKARDPQRLYGNRDRRAGFDRAGGRCEGEWLPFVRCTRPANAGDHWLPHSKGGATSAANFVALCSVHNRSKSARIPSRFQTARLQMRRRKYMSDPSLVSAGQWFGR
ncbi:HNH endonuclease [Pseudoclavibacter sp. VKM Ac-2888]|uniref:HNH endonuclease n=1 Tax=Pseudoclavibacter sp. VKM Ac-2888 TaxID=2783830 RepID=UPI00188B951C|nr:HNH endonuclease [Pseudoclavibacter sp. VKM Ac-2888]MBF4549365.1 HNH endonuclease [Pseudoclavibacter sp. VKM Ac-2888]